MNCPICNLIALRVKVVSAAHKEFVKNISAVEGHPGSACQALATPLGLAGRRVIFAARNGWSRSCGEFEKGETGGSHHSLAFTVWSGVPGSGIVFSFLRITVVR